MPQAPNVQTSAITLLAACPTSPRLSISPRQASTVRLFSLKHKPSRWSRGPWWPCSYSYSGRLWLPSAPTLFWAAVAVGSYICGPVVAVGSYIFLTAVAVCSSFFWLVVSVCSYLFWLVFAVWSYLIGPVVTMEAPDAAGRFISLQAFEACPAVYYSLLRRFGSAVAVPVFGGLVPGFLIHAMCSVSTALPQPFVRLLTWLSFQSCTIITPFSTIRPI